MNIATVALITRYMTDPDIVVADRSVIERIRYWWSIYLLLGAVIGAICGGIGVGFAKFTIYYLAEAASIKTLSDLKMTSDEVVLHLKSMDAIMQDRRYADQTTAKAIADLTARVQAIDQRSDDSMKSISTALTAQDKTAQQILLLLQPQPKVR